MWRAVSAATLSHEPRCAAGLRRRDVLHAKLAEFALKSLSTALFPRSSAVSADGEGAVRFRNRESRAVRRGSAA